MDLADIAVALAHRPDPHRRAALERLAVLRLAAELARRRTARLQAVLCRLGVDRDREEGEDADRDAAAA
ncbi:MAG: hypothetical protein ACLGIG_07015 [Actinomycetes bacterium]